MAHLFWNGSWVCLDEWGLASRGQCVQRAHMLNVLNQLRQASTTSSVVAVKGRGFMFSS